MIPLLNYILRTNAFYNPIYQLIIGVVKCTKSNEDRCVQGEKKKS